MAYTTINKPSDYFNTLLYSGNNTAQRQLTGVGFQPDLVWIKGRSGTYGGGYPHFVFDSVRGVGKQIHTNLTNVESTNLNNLYSFDSDGFSLGQSGVDAVTNGPSTEYVAWNWLAGGTGVSNTDGSIASTVSVNQTAGFSIVTYTSTTGTVGHGLGVTPKVVIMKARNLADQWTVGHNSLPSWTYGMALNTASTQDGNATFWNSTAPTSTVFYQGSWDNGYNKVAYCFAEVKGFSKFGSYVGNGSADGTFIYTGMKPAFVIVKATVGQSWFMYDNKRLGYNENNYTLLANGTNSEISGEQEIDILSNGFKMRSPDSPTNASGQTYIYMAFAEQPLVGDNPATAR